MQTPPNVVSFFLDEGLPFVVAEALAAVHHPITSARAQGTLGWKDPQLIPWMAAHSMVWVTKDDEARFAHIQAIRSHQLSVVWVRGLNGRKNAISLKQLHLMLTVKLPQIEQDLAKVHGPRHFCIYMNIDTPTLIRINEADIRVGRPLINLGRGRRKS